MLLASFPAGPWQTNCYVAATGPGEECVIIDPGIESQPLFDPVGGFAATLDARGAVLGVLFPPA